MLFINTTLRLSVCVNAKNSAVIAVKDAKFGKDVLLVVSKKIECCW